MSYRLHLALGLAASLGLASACGDDETTFIDEDPPTGGNEGGFDPGPSPSGPSSGAYGYGANGPTTSTVAATSTDAATSTSSGTGGEPPPECADELKRCAHVFTYENADATSVEVRGDFEPGAWDAGVPMEKSGSTWSAEIALPWDVDVQYKFFIDGSQYVTDPANPDQVDDGFGGLNSLLDGATCPDDYTCAEAP